MKRRKRLIIISIITIFVLFIFVVGYFALFSLGNKKKGGSFQIYTVTYPSALILSGQVSSEYADTYGAEASLGTLKSVDVSSGSEVQAGQDLMTFTNSSVDLQSLQDAVDKSNLSLSQAQQNLASLESQLAQAQQTLANDQAQVSKYQNDKSAEGQANLTSAQASVQADNTAISGLNSQILTAQQAIQSAQLDVQQSNQALTNGQNQATTVVTASRGGIALVSTDSTTGVKTVQVVSTNINIIGTVTEFDYSKLAVGDSVTLTPLSSNQSTTGTITQIDKLPQASTANGTGGSTAISYNFTVKPDKFIQYGFSVQISLQQKLISLPNNSIISKNYVWLYKNGKVTKTTLTFDSQHHVLTGLKVGDKIVTNPDNSLKDGKSISVGGD